MKQKCVSKFFAIAVRGINQICTVFVKNDFFSEKFKMLGFNNWVKEKAYLFPFECLTLEKNQEQSSTKQAQSKKLTKFSMFHFEVI